jgi:hypothetical protein
MNDVATSHHGCKIFGNSVYADAVRDEINTIHNDTQNTFSHSVPSGPKFLPGR